jgi:hypothetical protein
MIGQLGDSIFLPNWLKTKDISLAPGQTAEVQFLVENTTKAGFFADWYRGYSDYDIRAR